MSQSKKTKMFILAMKGINSFLKLSGLKPYAQNVNNRDRINMYHKLVYGESASIDCNIKDYAISEYEKIRVKRKRPTEPYTPRPISNATKIARLKRSRDKDFLSLKQKMIKSATDSNKKTRKQQYREFLKSEYWNLVRIMKLKEQPKCKCGADKFLQVHHLTYEHHYNEHLYLDDLVVLCKSCHKKAHGK